MLKVLRIPDFAPPDQIIVRGVDQKIHISETHTIKGTPKFRALEAKIKHSGTAVKSLR